MLVLIGLAVLTIRFWPGVFVASKFHVFALGMLAALIRRRWVGRLSSTAIAAGHVVAMAILVIFLVPGLGQTLLGATPFDRQADPAFTSFYGSLPRGALAAVLALTLSFESRFARSSVRQSRCGSFGPVQLFHLPAACRGLRRRHAFGLTTLVPGYVGTLAVLAATLAGFARHLPSRRGSRPARNTRAIVTQGTHPKRVQTYAEAQPA